MDEANLCDKIALMQKGKIMIIDTPENITKTFQKKLFGFKTENKYELLKLLRKYEHSDSVFSFGDSIHYTDKRDNIAIEELFGFLKDNNISSFDIKQIEPNIEDTFMALMNRGSDE